MLNERRTPLSTRRKTNAKHRACTHIYRYAKLEKMENWNVKLLEKIFLDFTKNIMDRKLFAKLLEILAWGLQLAVASVNTEHT
jgi:hypothetical protein